MRLMISVSEIRGVVVGESLTPKNIKGKRRALLSGGLQGQLVKLLVIGSPLIIVRISSVR